MKKKITIGILAHVDAGKTTLSEALLYISGKIRTLGRVDHKNTYLDINPIERERGITVFSKQARFSTESCDFILLDTPGHTDLSAEAERALSLLDYAILVISAPDGVQNHTKTLWQLLDLYKIPTFIFVNKTDISIKFKDDIEKELQRDLSPKCVAFYEKQTKNELDEKLALVREEFLEDFLSGTPINNSDIAHLTSRRELFPCFFGSALRMEGVDFFLSHLDALCLTPTYDETAFSARVYKIAYQGNIRLTHMKITGGTLSARDEITYLSSDGNAVCEKVGQIRLYSGNKFEQTDSVTSGEVCTAIGLSATFAGQGLGAESDLGTPIIEPVLSYRIVLPDECDPVVYFRKFKEFEEEEPSLRLCWNEELSQINAMIMGEIQVELLKRLILDRFGIDCKLDAGKILYKEKISARAIGVGHFEPLRHYAEVQLLLEPQPKGTGLVFDTDLPENSLSINWQRLILSALYEKDHRGVCVGASLTDTKITLIGGKAHLKHTDGGDFREAALRAVRQGLMRVGCVLLEPYYRFILELPSVSLGRAISELQGRAADFEIEETTEDTARISGKAPVATLHDYAAEVLSYTKGQGKITCIPDGYYPCHNSEEIISASAYDPCADLDNTPNSVFCSQGSGFIVPWDKVDEYKHIDIRLSDNSRPVLPIPSKTKLASKYSLSDDDLEAIMLREFGPIRRKKYSEPKINATARSEKHVRKAISEPEKRMLIIDGYNVIYSWESLKELADFSLEKARDTLMDILSNYVAFTKTELILVFDAYLVKDGRGTDMIKDGYRVVFTKEDQTADTFIEQLMHELGPNYNIKVVTGDRLVQFSAVHSGILRMTSREFEEDVIKTGNEITAFIKKLTADKK